MEIKPHTKNKKKHAPTKQTAKYRYPNDGVYPRKGIDFTDKDGKYIDGRTEQCHKDECNINNIIKKYNKTGLLTHVNKMKADYFDNTKINEYQEGLNLVRKSDENFAELPSTIRERFNNDTGKFLEFVTNDKNLDEMYTLGLATKPTPPVEETPAPAIAPAETE